MIDEKKLDIGSHNETLSPRRKVVMLGASNLSRAFPIAVSMTQQAFEGPLSFYVAKGHGRSYGQESSCLGKKNPGIFSCGIWRALEQEKSMPISAVMTDIGNDLAYEVPVEKVIHWVEGCLDRLLALNARIVLSDLPLEVLREVGTMRYRCFRTLLFPACRLSWTEMLQRAELLSQRLNELAEQREIPVFIVPKQWYGLDPIHPRYRHLAELWAQLVGLMRDSRLEFAFPNFSWSWSWYLRRLRAQQSSFFSVSRSAKQPSGRLRDGSTISLF